ncbi:MAG TPA: CotH kinase family protein, partial [Candidatus Limnocylindria bacterium]|nr:CotH kinase family protein [Candidatus Limnocylindria bacterium]
MNVPRFCRGLPNLVLALALTVPMPAADTFNSAYISEFLADNQNGLLDDNRERSGWIELYNGGNAALNLSGWFLTDSPTNLARWRFPGVVLLPDKFMIVFSSGVNHTDDLAHLHTNFRLSKKGGYLALVNPSTNVVSEFAPSYPKQSANVSFGRVRGEPALRGPFVKPTPGRANASSGPGFAPEVIFSRPSFNFTETFTLELSSRATGAVIRYTRDGTLPSTNSAIYVAPLIITNTAHIRARAYQESLFPGPPGSEAYVKLFTNVLNFTSTLPVLIMDTFGKNAPVSQNDLFVRLSLHEPIAGKTSLTDPPTLTTRAGFHVRGSTSSGFPQSPFAVEFLDEFNEERSLAPLGLPADSDWVLYAPNAYDPVMIHNPFIHQLSRDMGRYSPRTRFVEVFLVRSSGRVKEAHYHGVYVLTEKIKIARHRVNIERVGAEDLKPPQVTGGYVLKFDRLGPGENGFFGSGDRGLVNAEPKEQTLRLPQRAPQRKYLESFVGDFNRALHGPDWKDPNTGYRAYLDVEAAIDFHVLEVLSGNVDAMVLSTYFYKPRNRKIICGPHWDFDRALGSIDERDANPRQWNTGPFFGGEWWPRLFSDPDFWQQWVDRWQELRAADFSLTNMNVLIDRFANEVREAQPREYAKWGLQPRGGSYQSEIDLMKDWLANRVDFIDGQFVQPPRLVRNSDRFSFIAATNATVYYTLDGSDPRLSPGVISSNAVPYTGPIQMKAGDSLVARAYDLKQRQRGGPQKNRQLSSESARCKGLRSTRSRLAI